MPFTVFGFGSLVQRATLKGVVRAEPGTVRGWRRAWRASGRRPTGEGVCSLSVIPADDTLEGLFITFEDDQRQLVSEREKNYDALPLDDRPDALIYRVKPEFDRWGQAATPIALSYVDVVLGGYLAEFGEAGAERFMATTDGWFVPIVDDRAAPTYPRAVSLTAQQRRFVDRLLQTVDATVTTPSENGSA